MYRYAEELPAAYNGIGVLHFNGWGTERNYTAARLAFEQGAERGDPDSNFHLGALYSSGLGRAVQVESSYTHSLIGKRRRKRRKKKKKKKKRLVSTLEPIK